MCDMNTSEPIIPLTTITPYWICIGEAIIPLWITSKWISNQSQRTQNMYYKNPSPQNSHYYVTLVESGQRDQPYLRSFAQLIYG